MVGKLDIRIREKRKEDIDGIINIAQGLPEYFNPREIERLRKEAPGLEGLVVEKGDIVGYLLFKIDRRKDICIIDSIAVRKDLMSRSIGSELGKRLFKTAQNRGIGTVQVATLAPIIKYAPYEKTRNFYVKKLGFQEGEVVADYWYPGSDPAIVLYKKIGD
ncbi:MAG: GNAT family N-acetyltransferase [Deltaproteobacteria bacterium]|nr:MAG: GNAT family N-acetyltransferase [Deltaproteobacteria bacterium]